MVIKTWLRNTLAVVTLAFAGCSGIESKIVDHYSDNPKPVIVRMDPPEYAKALPDCDTDFNTEAEDSFEKDFPNLDLAGPEENLTKKNLDLLRKCIAEMPQDKVKALPLDVIIALKSDKSKTLVKFEDLEEGGHYSSSRDEATFFRWDEDIIYHEFAHWFHLTLPPVKKAVFEEDWKAITIDLKDSNGNRKTLDQVYGDDNVLGPKHMYDKYATEWEDGYGGQRHGFKRPYGANNLNEDVATMVEMVYSRTYADSNEDYKIMKQKVKLLAEAGIVTEEKATTWQHLNGTRRDAYSLDELAELTEYDDVSIRIIAIQSLKEKDLKGKYAKRVSRCLNDENEYVVLETIKYLKARVKKDYDSQVKAAMPTFNKECKELAKRYLRRNKLRFIAPKQKLHYRPMQETSELNSLVNK